MTPLKSLYASGDKDAHVFELSLYRGGQEIALSGASAQGYFIRADGYTVPITGAISGNVVTLTLSEVCYYIVGNFNLIIKVSTAESRKSVFWGNGYVVRSMTDAIVDEENVIPSLDELLAQIAATEAAAKAANTAATNANSATEAAQAATTNANKATKAANAAATNANTATKATQTATTNANTAAGKIDNMTVQVSGLEAGAAPTADLSLVDGHYNLSFAIPKGDKGATGATPKITVKVVTGEAGTQASVTQSGTAENPVITLTIPRGDTGSLGNLTINGKAPDGAGKVTLTAADVGALDKDVHMYNLLDNSDFVHPIAQAGVNGAHGATGYAVDRWIRTSGATVSQAADGLKIVSDKTSWTAGIMQRIEVKRFADVMTFAVRGVFPVACRLFVFIDSGTVNFAEAYFQGDTAERTLVAKLTKPDGLTGDEVVNVLISPDTQSTGTAAVVRWAALYEGEYTAETLPPYVPKGYAAELAECLRYYRRIKADNETFAGYASNGVAYAFIPLQTMRISPTVTAGGKFYYTLGSAQGTTTETATAHNANANRVAVKCAVSVTGICTGLIEPLGDIDISADL
nr:MAG TPA: BppU domain protein [Caudoviricetes sp.]